MQKLHNPLIYAPLHLAAIESSNSGTKYGRRNLREAVGVSYKPLFTEPLSIKRPRCVYFIRDFLIYFNQVLQWAFHCIGTKIVLKCIQLLAFKHTC